MNSKEFMVYRHISPSNKVYVGITCQQANHRWKRGKGYPANCYFTHAIEKYGWDNIKHEILFSHLKESDAKMIEIDLIFYYKKNGICYNITDGGEGVVGLHNLVSQGTKDKISHTLKGKYSGRNSPNYGKHLSDETKRKMSESQKGEKNGFYHKRHSEESIRKMSIAHSMHKCSEETKKKHSEIMKSERVQEMRKKKIMKPVYQIDRISGEIIKEWESATTAAKELGLSQGYINNVLRGLRNHCGGFCWKYKTI